MCHPEGPVLPKGVSSTTTSSDNDTNKNKLLRNINHEGWAQSLATFCKTIPFVMSVLLQN